MLRLSAFFLYSSFMKDFFILNLVIMKENRQNWGHFMKKSLLLVIFLCLAMFILGCELEDPDEDASGVTVDILDGQSEIEAGQLTAGEWNDLENFLFYQSLFLASEQDEKPFYNFRTHPYFQLKEMLKVHVIFEEINVPFVEVILKNELDETIYQGITDIFGKVYFFPSQTEMNNIAYISLDVDGVVIIYDETITNDILIDLENLLILPETNIIDIMFVIDTTGSMGDELSYLQVEIEDVMKRIQETFLDADIRIAFLFYRDITDDYITRCFDFSSDIDSQLEHLKDQSAGGGGDFPEASERALYEAMRKNWTKGHSTKLLFHVADAPPHEDPESMMMYKETLLTALNKGIKIIPVASSGVDKLTEFLMRAEAMLTGGTYVFLTNHSGIGHEKIEPSVGAYVVEYLNDLLVRLIKTYHSGEIFDKIPFNQQNQQNNSN